MQSLIEENGKIIYFSNKAMDIEIKLKAGEKLVFKRDDKVSMIVHKGRGEFRIGRRKIKIREKDILHSTELNKKILIAITSMIVFIHVEGLLL